MASRYIFLTILALCLAIFWSMDSSYAQVQITLSASHDNTLYEHNQGLLSNGAGQHFFVGRTAPLNGGVLRRGLIAFSIADSIPAGASVESVILTLFMSKTISGSQTVSLRKVSASWGEGTSNAPTNEGGGASATDDDATWIHRFYDSDLWATSGGDYSATVSASQSVGSIGSYAWGSTDEMVANVQDWLDNPLQNFGWILIGNEATTTTAKRFDTKEHPTVGNRPVMTVTYSPPTGVENSPERIPEHLSLAQNYPNPFNRNTVIRYRIPLSAAGATLELKIFNVLGQRVRTLVEDGQTSGEKSVQWDGRDSSGLTVGSGIYIYRLEVGDFVRSKKMLFLK
jgi:hypothetical protein